MLLAAALRRSALFIASLLRRSGRGRRYCILLLHIDIR